MKFVIESVSDVTLLLNIAEKFLAKDFPGASDKCVEDSESSIVIQFSNDAKIDREVLSSLIGKPLSDIGTSASFYVNYPYNETAYQLFLIFVIEFEDGIAKQGRLFWRRIKFYL